MGKPYPQHSKTARSASCIREGHRSAATFITRTKPASVMKDFIDDIATATDEEKLKKKVQDMFGDRTTIDKETVGNGGYWPVPDDVIGVLVKTRSDAGAVRTIGGQSQDENVRTSPEQSLRYCIISVMKEQKCAILGSPSFRLIKRLND